MRRLIVAATVAGALVCAAADQALTYAAGDTSLGDGALTLTYDDDGKIVRIVSNAAKGDTLALGGEPLAFGAGAVIETAGLGDLIISNAISGTDGLLVTNTSSAPLTMEWWGEQLLHNESWTTVFENVDLGNLELVSSDEKTYRNRSRAEGIWDPAGPHLSNPQMMYPFWVKRGETEGVATMTAQLQCLVDDVMVKFIKLELKQDGANVVARAVDAGYFRTNEAFSVYDFTYAVYRDDMDALGARWLADPDPAVNPRLEEMAVKVPGSGTAGGYGVGQLTVRRTDVPGVDFRAPSDASLSFGGDLKIAANARARRMEVTAYSAQSDDSLVVDGLWESGGAGGAQSTPLKGSGGTFAVVAEKRGHANPCDALLKNFATVAEQQVDRAFDSGTGDVVLYHSIFDLTNIPPCTICGKSMPWQTNPGYSIATPHHWRFYTNGVNSYATVQMQGSNSTTMIRCVILKFRQDVYAVKVSIVTNLACYTPMASGANKGEGYFGMDFENTPADFPGFYSKYTKNTGQTSADPFSVSNLVCQFSRPGEYLFTVNASNQMQNARLVVAGKSDGTRIFANINYINRLPLDGEVEVRQGGTLNVSSGGGGPDDATQNTTARITVYPGGVLRTWGGVQDSRGAKWAFRRRQRIDLLGGEMLPAWMHSPGISVCYLYLNNLTLADGGRVTCDIPFWAGNTSPKDSYHWLVRGSSPSYIDSPVQFLGNATGGWYEFQIDVADVTGDAATDLFMTKPITRYSSTELSNIRVGKYGPGTMEIQETIDVINGVYIYGGAFRLAGSGLTDDAAQKFRLCGGTLEAADGTANVCGPLSIAARGGRIRLGADATLTFADSSAETWEAENKVVVEGFAEKSIRFGTSGAAAPNRRLFALADGTKLRVGEDGYLTAILPATRISIR